MLRRNVTAFISSCSFLALILAAPISSWSTATANPRLKVDFGGYGGSDCKPTRSLVLLAGSQAEIVIEVIDTSFTSYAAQSGVAPKNIVLAAAVQTVDTDSFREMPDLIERLKTVYYVTQQQMRLDSLREAGERLNREYLRPSFHYLITIPEDLGGKYLCISASFDSPMYGRLSGSDCIRIDSPCSKEDSNHVSGTFICFAVKAGNPMRATELTDSLLSTGWHWWTGLMWARSAARELGLYEKEIVYLDELYRVYHRVTPTGAIDSVREEQEYQRLRREVIDLREQQR